MEEAAQMMESEMVPALTKNTDHLILIGDHKQLRSRNAVYELARDFNIDVSLFERLIKNEIPYYQLNEQLRMHPSISSLLVPHIYEQLSNHPATSVEHYENVKGIKPIRLERTVRNKTQNDLLRRNVQKYVFREPPNDARV